MAELTVESTYPEDKSTTTFFLDNTLGERLKVTVNFTSAVTDTDEYIYLAFVKRSDGDTFFVAPFGGNPYSPTGTDTNAVFFVGGNVLVDPLGYHCEVRRYPNDTDIFVIARGTLEVIQGVEYPTQSNRTEITPI